MVDLPITDEIRALGVSKITLTTDQLTVYNSSESVQSRLYNSSLERTLTELQDKMIFSGHFGDQITVEKIIILLSNIYVDDQERQSRSRTNSTSETFRPTNYTGSYTSATHNESTSIAN